MFFFFPISTDAPVYYWPFATVGLIALNILAFCVTGPFGPAIDSGWVLVHGDGLHPVQWVSSAFAHAGFGHLIGNMVFLWVFGLVVEGKLGWKRFLACYLAIGVGENLIEQVLMLGYSGAVPSGSLGASTAIYGVMAMAIVWAPKNEVNIFYFMWLVVIFTGTIDISIAVLAGVFIGLDVLWVTLRFLFADSAMGTSWLHVAGALIGFPLGIALYKRGIVDCEGWDMFHVWRGDYGATADRDKEDAEISKKLAERRQRQAAEHVDAAQQQLAEYLEADNGLAAYRLYCKMREADHELRLEAPQLAAMVRGLHAAGLWRESAPFMAQLIESSPERADAVRLKLAQVCVVELERPGRALELLGAVHLAGLPDPHRDLAAKIARRAERMQAEGVVELDDDQW